MSHTEYSAQFVQYSSVFLGLEEALDFARKPDIGSGTEMLKLDIKLHISSHKSFRQETIAPMDNRTSLPKF